MSYRPMHPKTRDQNNLAIAALNLPGDSAAQWLASRLMAQEVKGSTPIAPALQLPSEE